MKTKPCPRCGTELSLNRETTTCRCGLALRRFERRDGDEVIAVWWEPDDGRNGGQIVVGILVTATIAFLMWLAVILAFLM